MHVLLFDIDGTLLRSGGAGKLALETAFREVLREVFSAAATARRSRIRREIWRKGRALRGESPCVNAPRKEEST